MKLKRTSASLWATVLGVFSAARCDAKLLAYEGFSYTAAAGIAGQNGGTGWNGVWQAINTQSPAPVTSSGSEIFSGNPTEAAAATGNAAFVTNSNRVGRNLDTTATGTFAKAGLINGSGNIGAFNTTVWVSAVLRQTSTSDQFFEFEFHQGNLGDPGRVMGIGNDAQNQRYNLRTGSINDQTLGNLDTADHLFVMSVSFALGADTVAVYEDPTGTTVPAIPTFVTTTNSDLSFNGLSLAAYNGGQTMYADEIRLGTTYADVVGAVPEPASMATLLIAGLAMLTRPRCGRSNWTSSI